MGAMRSSNTSSCTETPSWTFHYRFPSPDFSPTLHIISTFQAKTKKCSIETEIEQALYSFRRKMQRYAVWTPLFFPSPSRGTYRLFKNLNPTNANMSLERTGPPFPSSSPSLAFSLFHQSSNWVSRAKGHVDISAWQRFFISFRIDLGWGWGNHIVCK